VPIKRLIFDKLGSLYAKSNIISKPITVFNVNETGIAIVTKPTEYLTQVGRKAMHCIAAAEKGKTNIIITCKSASSYVLPPR